MVSIADITLRDTAAADADAIGGIQAAAWRMAYTNVLTPAFLSGPIVDDRIAFWRRRLQAPADGRRVLLACRAETQIGFVCALTGVDPRWSALIDNLHVLPASQGGGVGTRLLGAAAGWIARQEPGSALHLWVFEANEPARRFYERLGGTAAERAIKGTADGGEAPALRITWARAADLAGRDGAAA